MLETAAASPSRRTWIVLLNLTGVSLKFVACSLVISVTHFVQLPSTWKSMHIPVLAKERNCMLSQKGYGTKYQSKAQNFLPPFVVQLML